MGLKMKTVNIVGGSPIFRGGGHKKKIYIYIYIYIWGMAWKGEHGQFAGGLAKNREESVFEGGWSLDAHYDLIWYMPELKIGLADVSALNFDQSFLQFNAKKKINAKKSSWFEFKCWKLKAASLNI